MGEQAKLARARLVELGADFTQPAPDGKSLEVQFNPETLKVTYQNKPAEQKGAGDQRGNATRQVVGAGSTKLALQLWFDVNAPRAGGVKDVRELTTRVAYFMMPKPPAGKAKKGSGAEAPSPPGVRFAWGTFEFDGLMDSLDETLDYFSPDGRPLRATLNVGMSGQLEIVPAPGGASRPDAAAGPTSGTRPLSAAPAGSSLPGLAAGAGVGLDWQIVASANGIENPRLLEPGRLIDLDVTADVTVGVGVGLGVGVSLS
jgi:hypothetical protein